MNTNELTAFCHVVRLGSVSRAAEVLYLTQPALSKRIQRLEEELGYPLLIRKKGGRDVELTEQGKIFYEIAQKWRQMYVESLNIRNMGVGANLTFSSVNSIAENLVPVACAEFAKLAPQVNITFFQNSSLEIYSKLEQFQLDFGLAAESKYAKNIQTIPLFSEKLRVIAPIDFSEKDPLRTSELNVRNELRVPLNSEIDSWHDYWFGTSVMPRLITTTIDLTARLIVNQGGWAVVPISNALETVRRNPSLRIYQIDNPPPDRLIYLIRRSGHKERLVDSFVECIVDCAKRYFPFVPILPTTDPSNGGAR